MVGHLRIIENAVQNLHLCDRMIAMLCQPRFTLDQLPRNLIRYPAVTLAKKTYEVGTASLNLRKTNRQDLAALRLLWRDAPAQIHFAPSDAPLLAKFTKLREDALDQLLALFVH